MVMIHLLLVDQEVIDHVEWTKDHTHDCVIEEFSEIYNCYAKIQRAIETKLHVVTSEPFRTLVSHL